MPSGQSCRSLCHRYSTTPAMVHLPAGRRPTSRDPRRPQAPRCPCRTGPASPSGGHTTWSRTPLPALPARSAARRPARSAKRPWASPGARRAGLRPPSKPRRSSSPARIATTSSTSPMVPLERSAQSTPSATRYRASVICVASVGAAPPVRQCLSGRHPRAASRSRPTRGRPRTPAPRTPRGDAAAGLRCGPTKHIRQERDAARDVVGHLDDLGDGVGLAHRSIYHHAAGVEHAAGASRRRV